MIKLDIQGYCSDCEYFDPEIKREIKWGWDHLYDRTDTLIRCSHRNTCEGIKRYLEATNKESQSKEGQCT